MNELSEQELDSIHKDISLIVVKNRLTKKTHNVLSAVFDPISDEEFTEAYEYPTSQVKK